jgi:hypothetical protein
VIRLWFFTAFVGVKKVIKSLGLVGREDYLDWCGCTDREANELSEIGWKYGMECNSVLDDYQVCVLYLNYT